MTSITEIFLCSWGPGMPVLQLNGGWAVGKKPELQYSLQKFQNVSKKCMTILNTTTLITKIVIRFIK